MSSPKTPQHLTDEIEALVVSYVDELRQTVQQAIDRSFSVPVMRTAATKRTRGDVSGRSVKRRSTEQLNELSERLYELICAQPGEPMIVFADEVRT